MEVAENTYYYYYCPYKFQIDVRKIYKKSNESGKLEFLSGTMSFRLHLLKRVKYFCPLPM